MRDHHAPSLLASAIIAAALAPLSAHAANSLTIIGTLATGVSADGQAVSAYVDTGSALNILRWTATGGLQNLGQGVGLEISRDGRFIVGQRTTGAFRHTPAPSFNTLGNLPGAPLAGMPLPTDISADGAVVVGTAVDALGFRAFRWTPSGGMVGLGRLPATNVYSEANSISADASVTVGSSSTDDGKRAVRWLGTNTTPQDLGLPTGLSGFTEANAVSADGQVIVGVWSNGIDQNQAFRWTAATGYELLGDLPGGPTDSIGKAANIDGSVIVGTANPGADLPDEAFYWTRTEGLRSLRSVLHLAGIDTSAWQTFDAASDLSSDGLTIVGYGTLTNGTTAGFRAVIPTPAASALLALAATAAARRRR
jgi:probable HAF family extracellular repeat protein